jgi:2-polyprenyl-6-methoxyphenol hydroxylase-like FAD-dependent oxidoreductase
MAYGHIFKKPVTIVGAGFAGLSLARVLLSRGVPTVIYEKASSASRHNYGITLYPRKFQSLLSKLIPSAMEREGFRSHVGVGSKGTMNSLNLILQLKRKDAFRANRGSLEKYLGTGLDIRWDSAIEGVEKAANGGWVLHFEDGKTVESDYVVAADGVHSPIRQLLLPDEKPTVLPCVVYSGKRRMSREVYDASLAQHLAGSTLIEYSSGNNIFQFSVDEINEDQVSVRWTFVRDAKKEDDPLFRPDRTFEAATETPLELFSEIEAIGKLPKPWNSILDVQSMKEDKIQNWLMRSISLDPIDVQNLRQQGLFIVGDAAYAKPILWGAGANQALRKSTIWADIIIEEKLEKEKRLRKRETTGIVAKFVEGFRKSNDQLHGVSEVERAERRERKAARAKELRKLQKEKNHEKQKEGRQKMRNMTDVKVLEEGQNSSDQERPEGTKNQEEKSKKRKVQIRRKRQRERDERMREMQKITDVEKLEESQKPGDQEKLEVDEQVEDSKVAGIKELEVGQGSNDQANDQEKAEENKKVEENKVTDSQGVEGDQKSSDKEKLIEDK